jgi:hypothetical protein
MPGRDNPTNALPHKKERREIVPYRVFVAGLPYDIVVYSTSKSESVAVGEFAGEHVQASGANALDAAEAWTKAAKALSELKYLAKGPPNRNGVHARRSN